MKRLIAALGLVMAICTAEAKVTLPALYTDNMVLQQKTNVIFHGHATAGKEVIIKAGWSKRPYVAKTDKQGNWKTEIPTPSAGGPCSISFYDGDEHILQNVMIGEIWLCSGQSNMEMPVGGWGKVMNYESEISSAHHPSIRLFQVKKSTSLVPETDFSSTQGGWQECSPKTVAPFSSVAYFFALRLQKALKVPVGVIDCTWGGTPAEAWTSYDGLKDLADYEEEMEMIESLGFDPEKIEARYAEKRAEWYQSLYEHDMGWRVDRQVWADPGYSDENWKEMNLPGYWEDCGMPDFDGVMWFRKTIEIPHTWARKSITVDLGMIDDEDIVYFNGVEIGRGSGHESPRQYIIPQKLVKRGEAILTVRVTDYGGKGGINGKAKDLQMSVKGKEPISLAGDWKYLAGLSLSGFPAIPPSPKSTPGYPTTLFNAMVHPITQFPVQGVIWYQGESNVGRADEYADLFTSLITDWRNKWHKPKMPFYFVQLANYLKPTDVQPDSEWAALREAQAQALHLSHTGMAVAIDIGDANDIHPKNKQEVARRLSLLALQHTYKKKRAAEVPAYRDYRIEGNTIRLSFDTPGKGFLTSEEIKGFAVAGADHVFYPATATVQKKEIIVESADVPHPIAVRYGWADNPECTLRAASGLPVAPFRTDRW
ncbi:sialate O-acetylesterase [Phocaeicola sp.]